MKILVTGANGQLGKEIRKRTEECENGSFIFTDVEELNICSDEEVREFFGMNRVDAVVNCAAYTAVDRAEEEPQKCRMLNAEAPRRLAEEAQKQGAAFIQISTDYVFDGKNHVPYREEDRTNPLSVYGETKEECEREVMRACEKAMILRTAWLYSENGNNFVKTMLRLGREREQLGVVYDQVGTPTCAGDLAETIILILKKGVKRGIYHYTDEGVTSWYDFAKEIHRMAGIKGCRVNPIRTEEYPTKAERPHYSVLDKSKIKKEYQIEIPHWQESLKKCVESLIKE